MKNIYLYSALGIAAIIIIAVLLLHKKKTTASNFVARNSNAGNTKTAQQAGNDISNTAAAARVASNYTGNISSSLYGGINASPNNPAYDFSGSDVAICTQFVINELRNYCSQQDILALLAIANLGLQNSNKDGLLRNAIDMDDNSIGLYIDPKDYTRIGDIWTISPNFWNLGNADLNTILNDSKLGQFTMHSDGKNASDSILNPSLYQTQLGSKINFGYHGAIRLFKGDGTYLVTKNKMCLSEALEIILAYATLNAANVNYTSQLSNNRLFRITQDQLILRHNNAIASLWGDIKRFNPINNYNLIAFSYCNSLFDYSTLQTFNLDLRNNILDYCAFIRAILNKSIPNNYMAAPAATDDGTAAILSDLQVGMKVLPLVLAFV